MFMQIKHFRVAVKELAKPDCARSGAAEDYNHFSGTCWPGFFCSQIQHWKVSE